MKPLLNWMHLIPVKHATHLIPFLTHLIPFLVGIGITAQIRTGVGGIITSCMVYHSLFLEVTSSLEKIAKSILTIQTQLESLLKLSCKIIMV